MSSRAKVNAGSYNRPITILAKIDTTNAQGGQDTTYSDYYACWADMDSWMKGRGLTRPFFAEQLDPMATRTMSIRWQSSKPIDDTMRVRHVKGAKTHIYQIVGVDNFKEADVEIVLFCTEIQAKGSS